MRARLIGSYAVAAAVVSIVVAPLLALSYFKTDEGAEELGVGTVAAWADPVTDVAGGLLTFASPDRVYSTYLQVFALLVPAVLLCAWTIRNTAPVEARSRAVRWGWRVALLGYVMLSLGVLLAGFLLIAADPDSGAVNGVFFGFVIPGLLVSTVGSTILGIGLVRAGYRPRPTPWLLALSTPLWLVGSIVLGHNSLGLIPLLVAWGVTGWKLASGARVGI